MGNQHSIVTRPMRSIAPSLPENHPSGRDCESSKDTHLHHGFALIRGVTEVVREHHGNQEESLMRQMPTGPRLMLHPNAPRMPYMLTSGWFGGQCRHIWHTRSVWVGQWVPSHKARIIKGAGSAASLTSSRTGFRRPMAGSRKVANSISLMGF